MKKKLKNYFYRIKFLFPHTLPVGFSALEAFISNICEVYELPLYPSYKNAIATAIMHLGELGYKKSPKHFAMVIKAAMAKQVAYEMIQKIRDEEKKAATIEINEPSAV